MEVLIVNQQEVAQLLPMSQCIDVMADALAALSRGQGIQPLQPVMWLPERVGALGMMPGYLGHIDAMGIKVVNVFPGNHSTEYDSYQGAVSTINEAGDFLFPKKEGAIGHDMIVAGIGQVLLGQHKGREGNEEFTLFKSLGLAIEGVASAQYAYQQGLERGVGTWAELGGRQYGA